MPAKKVTEKPAAKKAATPPKRTSTPKPKVAAKKPKNPDPCPHGKYRATCERACACGHACMEHDEAGECTEDCGCTNLQR